MRILCLKYFIKYFLKYFILKYLRKYFIKRACVSLNAHAFHETHTRFMKWTIRRAWQDLSCQHSLSFDRRTQPAPSFQSRHSTKMPKVNPRKRKDSSRSRSADGKRALKRQFRKSVQKHDPICLK